MLAKVYALLIITVQKQKQRMTSKEGLAKLQLNTLQSSKNDVINDYLLTQEFFLKMLSNEEQMNSVSHLKGEIQSSHLYC